MKHLLNIIFMLTLILTFSRLAGAFLLGDPVNGSNNPHNLSFNSNNAVKAQDPAIGGTTEICIFCHTPHGATPQSILWNRKDLDPSVHTNSFQLYNSATLVIKTIPEAQYNSADPAKYPNGSSRMCLSCHDGTTAMGYGIGDLAAGGFYTMTVSNLDTRASQIDLAQSHPISFVYDDGVGQVLTQIQSAKGPPFNDYQLPTKPYVVLDSQGRMQCTTCHDPHDDAKEVGGIPPFWRNTSDGIDKVQTVCDDCHLGTDGTRPPPYNHDPSFPLP